MHLQLYQFVAYFSEWPRARLSRLATRYVHIVPHYRTPLSYPTIRSWFAGCRVYLHFTIRNKGLVSSQLLSAVWPGKQTVSRRSTSHVCLYTTPGRSYLYVRYKTALRLSIILKRDSGCMSHTKRTFLRLLICPYLKTFEKGFAFIYF